MKLALTFLVALLLQPSQEAAVLDVEMVGNAGVVLTDGATSLLVDLPYEPGAFGYMDYDPASLGPPGEVVSVFTHHHADHFDAALFAQRPEWRLVGPPSVAARVAPDRVLDGDSIEVGAFAIIAIPTPHTDDHRSYRIRWRGRVLFFTGDTEDPSAVPVEPRIDVLFVTPWLNCALTRSGRAEGWDRSVTYHRSPDGTDQACGASEVPEQGARFEIVPQVTDSTDLPELALGAQMGHLNTYAKTDPQPL